MLLSTFDVARNKPRVPRQLSPFDRDLLRERLRLALAGLERRDTAHIPAAIEQIEAALRQIGA